MNEPIIQCFKDDFDRFYNMLLKQIEVCPDSLWGRKEGGYIFWQQIFHAVAITEVYTLKDGLASKQTLYSRGVAMLSEEPPEQMDKKALMAFAIEMRQTTHEFIDSVTVKTLTDRHPRMSKTLGRECTNQQALIAMIRHVCYHLGCCDSVLRSHGIAGVY